MSPGPTTIGVVIHVPDPWGQQIAAIRSATGDRCGTGIPTHITLLPPTQVDRAQHDDFTRLLGDIAGAQPAFTVDLVGSATFRPISQVVFLALGRGESSCRELAAGLSGGAVRSPSPFAYHPHVTLAHDVPAPVLDRVQGQHADFTASFEVDDVCLYEMDAAQTWQLRSRWALRPQVRS